MSTSLATLTASCAGPLGLATSTSTASGSTTTLIDTSATSPIDSADSSSKYKNAWLKITVGTVNVGEVRRITGVNPSTSTFTVSRAFTSSTVSGLAYQIFPGVPPVDLAGEVGLKTYINDCLRGTMYRTRTLLSLIDDGDCERSGVAAWSVGSATVAKAALAVGSYQTFGKQYLRVTNTGAGGYAAPVYPWPCTPGATFHLRADFQPLVGTAHLILWDETNGAAIASKTAAAGAADWRYLFLQATVPAGCHAIAARLAGVEANAIIHWDNVSLRDSNARTMALPAWVTQRDQVEELERWRGGNASSGDDRAWNGQTPDPVASWDAIEDFGALVPYRIQYAPLPSSEDLLVVRGLRAASELASDADTTDVDPDYIKAHVLASIYQAKGQPKELAIWPARWAAKAHEHFRANAYSARLSHRGGL